MQTSNEIETSDFNTKLYIYEHEKLIKKIN